MIFFFFCFVCKPIDAGYYTWKSLTAIDSVWLYIFLAYAMAMSLSFVCCYGFRRWCALLIAVCQTLRARARALSLPLALSSPLQWNRATLHCFAYSSNCENSYCYWYCIYCDERYAALDIYSRIVAVSRINIWLMYKLFNRIQNT